MTLKLNGTNSEAAPAYAGDDADTGLQCGTNELKLVTGGSARATVDSSGNVGIGVTPSSWGGSRNAIQFDSAGAAYVCNDSTVGIVSNMYFDGANNKYINAGTASSAYFQPDNVVFQFAPSGSADGNGTFTTSTRIDADGVKFGSDTAAANALDEYEEGTWTPTCASDGNIGSSQYTCTYTKIGRLVTINCDIHALDNITSTNPIKIGGLPFVPSATSGELGSSAVHGERVGSSLVVAFLQYLGNSWVIRFRKGVGSSNYSDVDHSDLNDAGDNNMRFSLTYEITT